MESTENYPNIEHFSLEEVAEFIFAGRRIFNIKKIEKVEDIRKETTNNHSEKNINEKNLRNSKRIEDESNYGEEEEKSSKSEKNASNYLNGEEIARTFKSKISTGFKKMNFNEIRLFKCF